MTADFPAPAWARHPAWIKLPFNCRERIPSPWALFVWKLLLRMLSVFFADSVFKALHIHCSHRERTVLESVCSLFN